MSLDKQRSEAVSVAWLDEEQGTCAPDVGHPASMNDYGVNSITLHKDARHDAAILVEPSMVFSFSANNASMLRLWDEADHIIRPGQHLPAQLLQGPTFTFTAVTDHWNASRPDYLQVSFSQPCRVYLLLVSTGRVPMWIRSDFRKVADSKCSLQVDWRLPLHTLLLAAMTHKLTDCRSARLHLWERSQPCLPGKTFAFGGPKGRQVLADHTYIFMWRPLAQTELTELPQYGMAELPPPPALQLCEAGPGTGPGPGPPPLPGGGGGGGGALDSMPGEAAASGQSADGWQRTMHLEHLLKAVLCDDLDGVERACDAYQQLVQRAMVAGGLPPALAAAAAAPTPGGEAGEVPLWARPSFLTDCGRALTGVAAAIRAKPRLLLYLVERGAELDNEALRYLLKNCKALPTGGYHDVQHFVLSYILHQRNPLACALSFAMHLEELSRTSNKAKKREFSTLAGLLSQLACLLGESLRELGVPLLDTANDGDDVDDDEDEHGRHEDAKSRKRFAPGDGGVRGGGAFKPLTTLTDILAPRGVACSINDASPLQVAYASKNLDFMATCVVQDYLNYRWLGASYWANALLHPHPCAAADDEDPGACIYPTDNLLALRVLESSGFVGRSGIWPMTCLSRTLHVHTIAARPFFESPRGRWLFRVVCELHFLYTYHLVHTRRSISLDSWQDTMLHVYVVNLVVDRLQEYVYLYRCRLLDFFSNAVIILEAVALALLVGSMGCKIATNILAKDDPAYIQVFRAKDLLFNLTSILIWARTLQFVVPLCPSVGVVLVIFGKLVPQLLKFLVPGVVLMLGVAFTLQVTFQHRDISALKSIPNVMLLLLKTFLGETMFDVLDDEKDHLYKLYGNLIILLYTIIASVIVANLVIAFVNFNFEPARAALLSKFQTAEILARYEFMVERHLLGAPFTLPLMALQLVLPSGWRPMAGPSLVYRAGLMPLDGNPLPNESRANKLYPTGSNELPYIVFLLTLYPCLVAASWAGALLMAPYCILFFAFFGYRRWMRASDNEDGGDGGDNDGRAEDETPWAVSERRQSAGSTDGIGNNMAVGGNTFGLEPTVAVATTTCNTSAAPGSKAPPPPPPGTSAGLTGKLARQLRLMDLTPGATTGAGLESGLGDEQALRPLPSLPRGLISGDDVSGLYAIKRLRTLGSLLAKLLLQLLTRPLLVLLGAITYLLGLLGLVGGLWLGLYLWLGRLLVHSYFVLRSWKVGCSLPRPSRRHVSKFGAGGPPGAVPSPENHPEYSGFSGSSSTNSGASPNHRPPASPAGGAAGRHACWVRVAQAGLRNGGQVLQYKLVSEAMLQTGFGPNHVAAAAAGPWASLEPEAGVPPRPQQQLQSAGQHQSGAAARRGSSSSSSAPEQGFSVSEHGGKLAGMISGIFSAVSDSMEGAEGSNRASRLFSALQAQKASREGSGGGKGAAARGAGGSHYRGGWEGSAVRLRREGVGLYEEAAGAGGASGSQDRGKGGGGGCVSVPVVFKAFKAYREERTEGHGLLRSLLAAGKEAREELEEEEEKKGEKGEGRGEGRHSRGGAKGRPEERGRVHVSVPVSASSAPPPVGLGVMMMSSSSPAGVAGALPSSGGSNGAGPGAGSAPGAGVGKQGEAADEGEAHGKAYGMAHDVLGAVSVAAKAGGSFEKAHREGHGVLGSAAAAVKVAANADAADEGEAHGKAYGMAHDVLGAVSVAAKAGGSFEKAHREGHGVLVSAAAAVKVAANGSGQGGREQAEHGEGDLAGAAGAALLTSPGGGQAEGSTPVASSPPPSLSASISPPAPANTATAGAAAAPLGAADAGSSDAGSSAPPPFKEAVAPQPAMAACTAGVMELQGGSCAATVSSISSKTSSSGGGGSSGGSSGSSGGSSGSSGGSSGSSGGNGGADGNGGSPQELGLGAKSAARQREQEQQQQEGSPVPVLQALLARLQKMEAEAQEMAGAVRAALLGLSQQG